MFFFTDNKHVSVKAFIMEFNDYLVKRLSALSIQKTAGKENGYDASAAYDVSIFNSANAQDLQNIDYAKLLNSEDLSSLNDGVTDQTQKSLNSILKSFISLDEIQEAADANGDGKVDETELQEYISSIAGADGNAETLTMQDIDAVIADLGIDLDSIAETAMNDALKELQESVQAQQEEQEQKLEELEEEQKAQQAQQAQSSGGTSGSGSVGGGSYSNGGVSSASKKSADNTKSTAETIQELEKEISDKNAEIDEVEADAEKQIEEQEKAKEKAMKDNGVSDDEYKAYQEKEQELEKQITEKETAIKEQDEKITSNNATISSNENYISSLDSQIEANKSAISSLDSDSDSYQSKKSDMESKNAKLEEEKSAKEKENENLKKEVETAENKKKELEQQKTEIETQKQQLLSETLKNSKDFAKGVGSSEAVDAIKTQISKYDENISQIRNDKDTKVANLRQEVQTLETKLQDAKQKEQLDSVISENKVTTSNLPEDLFKKDGALAGKEDQVAEIAEKYGLEPEFLAAIMCLETGYGSSSLLNSCNNPGGTTGSGSAGSYTTSDGRTFAKYNSIEDGIEAMAKNLSGYTKYEGVSSVDIDHVDAIGNKYCVGGDWANKVRTIYNKIKA